MTNDTTENLQYDNTIKSNYICVVGGSNIDIYGRPFEKLKLNDSNPGTTGVVLGGVGRNIAVNLGKLGINVELITALGGDNYSSMLIDDFKDNNVTLNQSAIFKDSSTPTYLYIMDETGEMQYAIADMALNDNITIEFINDKMDIINNARACIIETNIPQDTIKYLVDNVKIPIYIDPVSEKKSEKIKDCLDGIYAIKANKIEAGYLASVDINNDEDIKLASKKLIDMGIKNVFISLGDKGLHYRNKNEYGFISPHNVEVVNTTGAGDSLLAGITFALNKGYSIKEAAEVAVAVSGETVASIDNVALDLSAEKILKKINKI